MATTAELSTIATTDAGPDAGSREEVLAACRAAKDAARAIRPLTRAAKDALLLARPDALVAATPDVVAANARDLENGSAAWLTTGLLDRLRLDDARVAGVADAL